MNLKIQIFKNGERFNMKKQIFLFSIFLFFYLGIYGAYANGFETQEATIKQVILEFKKIVNKQSEIDKKGLWAFNYAVQILKFAPESIEAFQMIPLVHRLNSSIEIRNKIDKFNLIDKITQENVDSTPIEIILSCIFPKKDLDDGMEKYFINLKKLSRSDSKYGALALYILMIDKEHIKEYYEEFKKRFPQSNGIPCVELLYLSTYFDSKNYDLAISKAAELIEKYKNINSDLEIITLPFNEFIFFCYIQKKDKENARKYYELIKLEMPDYYELKELENTLNNEEL